MKVYGGKPEKSGWYFNVIHRTGCFNNDPSNFIGLWTDYYDKGLEMWTACDSSYDFWADLPEILTPNGDFLLKNDEKGSVKFTLTLGLPTKKGCYIVALQPKANLSWYCSKDIEPNLLNSLGAVLQSDRFIDPRRSGEPPESYFCDDLDSVIGWCEFPELIFPDGKIINFNK